MEPYLAKVGGILVEPSWNLTSNQVEPGETLVAGETLAEPWWKPYLKPSRMVELWWDPVEIWWNAGGTCGTLAKPSSNQPGPPRSA